MDPRLIVEVRWGLMNGRKVAINPGASLRVAGRIGRILRLPHDDHLSALHFALDWDGERCRVRDLGSAEGTLINGEAAKEGRSGTGLDPRGGDGFLDLHWDKIRRLRGTSPTTTSYLMRTSVVSGRTRERLSRGVVRPP
jgi:hypothetical protein